MTPIIMTSMILVEALHISRQFEHVVHLWQMLSYIGGSSFIFNAIFKLEGRLYET
jgi:hypothetical protein